MLHTCGAENWIFPLVREKNGTLVLFVRQRSIMTYSHVNDSVRVCLFIRVLWLVCGVQGPRGLLHCLVPSFRSSSRAPAVHRDSWQICVFKSLVCNLNEAFGAKKKKKKQ